MEEATIKDGIVENKEPEKININTIEYSDIVDSLGKGIRDFQKSPQYGLAIGGFFALGGAFLFFLLYVIDLPYLFYPLMTGFALVAPFAAAGLYEVSRCHEQNEEPSWKSVLGAMRMCCGKDLAWMAVITVFSLIVWVDFAVFIYLMFFGLHTISVQELFQTILSTPKGALFLLVGNLFGFLFSLSVFSLTAVSFPLLFDREVDFVTAMISSVKAVIKNPRAMLSWLLVIGMALVISFATLFIGFFITLPVLGHATWHLYRQLIDKKEVA